MDLKSLGSSDFQQQNELPTFKNGKIIIGNSIKSLKFRADLSVRMRQLSDNPKLFQEVDAEYFLRFEKSSSKNFVSFYLKSGDKTSYKSTFNSRRAEYIGKVAKTGMINSQYSDFYEVDTFEILLYLKIKSSFITILKTFNPKYFDILILKSIKAYSMLKYENSEDRKTEIMKINKDLSTSYSAKNYADLEYESNSKEFTDEDSEKSISKRSLYREINYYKSLTKPDYRNYILNTAEQNFNAEYEISFDYISNYYLEQMFREVVNQYNSDIQNKIDIVEEYKKESSKEIKILLLTNVLEMTMMGLNRKEIVVKLNLQSINQVKKLKQSTLYKELENGTKNTEFEVVSIYNNPKNDKNGSTLESDHIKQVA
jgi:hypothetical protein